MSTSSKVSIVTLNWSRFSDLTAPWLEDMLRETPQPCEIVIVDQGSIKRDVVALQEAERQYPELKVVYLDHNSGFPEGCNIGAGVATGNYIVFMNNDIRLWGDWWGPIYQLLEAHPKSLVGPSLIAQKTGWNHWVVGDIEIHVPYLEGWLLAGRREILDEIGYFDPIYGSGSVEDVDYCWRAARIGYELIDCGPLPLKHLRGATVTDGRLDHFVTNACNLKIFKGKVARELGV